MQDDILPRDRFHTDLQDHLALFRKLDRVAHQVDDDLAETIIIADHHPGNVGVDMASQLQALLMGADGERFHCVAQAFAEIEDLAIEDELPGFDFREVENVVDYREQGFAGVSDRRQELSLLGRNRAFEDQFGHPDDGVQRGPDLVAHVGQEGALGAVGRFRRVFGRPQGLRRLLLTRDVARHPEGSDDLSRIVVQRHLGRAGPGHAAVWPRFPLLLIEDRVARANDLLLVGQGLRGVLAGEEIQVRLSQGFGRMLQAKEPGHGLVDPQKTAGRVLEVDVMREVIHQRMEEIPLLLQFLVRSDEFCSPLADARCQFFAGQFFMGFTKSLIALGLRGFQRRHAPAHLLQFLPELALRQAVVFHGGPSQFLPSPALWVAGTNLKTWFS